MVNYKVKDKDITLILCILGGLFGLHHFYNKQVKKGLLYLFTLGLFGIGWIIDIIQIATIKEIKNNIEENDNNTNKIKIKDNDISTKYFECQIIKECDNRTCSELIGLQLYLNVIDKEDLYEGYSDTDIKEMTLKVYQFENQTLPCEIKYNENNDHFEIIYKEHGHDDYFGYVPDEKREELNNIINNCNITSGGIYFIGGRFKEYNLDNNNLNQGTDDYVIYLKITYK